jgi:hypothetical protein
MSKGLQRFEFLGIKLFVNSLVPKNAIIIMSGKNLPQPQYELYKLVGFINSADTFEQLLNNPTDFLKKLEEFRRANEY